ncbi:hypothetical protein GCM10010218_59240 [Streptomyces mashuensis]|uniref:Uncharacterized protein n=1 Tax=Streptomyces mashuensis TaxID=33904 RepID=A0A919B8Z6_9ACTN|nr:hypothetical protein [Streptomyces mashuensis]GHF70055.1 hypothetical protein GCM10010218_59240 [Streptomyces mashuensis]
MAEPEFSATGVRIERSHRSLTRAGQVKIRDGRLELLTSYGREIDSAPVESVQAGKAWFAARDRARARVNGTRYVLTLEDRDARTEVRGDDGDGGSAVSRFLEAVRSAHRSGGKG